MPAVPVADRFDVRGVPARAAQHRHRERGRVVEPAAAVHVAALDEPPHERRRGGEEAQPQAGCDGLRERPDAHDGLGIEAPQGLRGRAVVGDLAVGVVLDDDGTGVAGHRDEFPPPRRGQRHTGRVGEGGHQIQQRYPPAGAAQPVQQRAGRVRVDAVVVGRCADEFAVAVGEDAQREVVRGRVDQDRVARPGQHRRHQLDALRRAGRDEHLLRYRCPRVGFAEPLAEPLDQRRRPGLVPVGQRLPSVGLQCLVGGGPPVAGRQGVGQRKSPAEVDDAGPVEVLDAAQRHPVTIAATSRAQPQERLTPEPPWP